MTDFFFAPDIKIELVITQRRLEKGRKVKVVGIMAGCEGRILYVADEPGKRLFLLTIADNQHTRWTAHVEDVLIQPVG